LVKSTTTKVQKSEAEEFVFTKMKEYLDINVKPSRDLERNVVRQATPNNAQVKLFVL